MNLSTTYNADNNKKDNCEYLEECGPSGAVKYYCERDSVDSKANKTTKTMTAKRILNVSYIYIHILKIVKPKLYICLKTYN